MSSTPAGLQRFNSYNRTATPKVDHSTVTDTIEVPDQQFNVVEREDLPPNGGYGWVCTACVFVMNAHTWGVNAAWAVFLSYYLERSTYPGTSQFEYALIGGLSIALACLSAPFVAASLRAFGTNITMGIGTLLLFGSLLTASFSTQIWHLFLSQGVCFGLGMGFLYMPATAVLPQWFSTKRSLSVGIAASGAGLGGVVYNILTGVLAQKIGLPWTYRVLAFCTLVANTACSLLVRDRNKIVKPRQESFDWREFKHIEVIFIVTWGVLCELGYVILLYSLPHYATTIGLSQSQGSIVGAMLSVGLGLGRPLVGYFSDRWGRINIAALMTLSCGVFSLVLWVPAKSYGLLLAFSLLAGFGCGTFWGTTTSVTAEVVGLQRLPTVFGVILISCAAPTTFAEPIGLQLVAASGYKAAQVFVGLMFIFAAGSVWFLRSWKILQIEEKARREQAGLTPDEMGYRFRTGLSWLSPKTLFKICKV